MTVNHDVVGSSPTGGASIAPIWVFFYFEKARIIAILALCLSLNHVDTSQLFSFFYLSPFVEEKENNSNEKGNASLN